MENISFITDANKLWSILMEGVNENPVYTNPKNLKAKQILKKIENIAYTNNEPTDVVFGTSGWRGIVGVSHTIQNVIRTTEGLVALVKFGNKKILNSIGVKSFEDFQNRGVVVGRDNRILGEQFAETVIGVLQKHNIKVYYAGEAPTPEYSAAIIQLNAAMSINLTPSHNPASYSGYKVNPADGGPSGEDITVPLAASANSFMDKVIEKSAVNWKKVIKIDSTKLYKNQITENISHILNLSEIKKFIKSKNIAIAIDHIHGATRKRPKAFLNITGKESNVKLFNEDDNILFHGVKPEPSAKNMSAVENWLKKQKTKYKLGVLLDPDGDRIRFTNGTEQVDMNNFGALAFHFLVSYKNIKGGVAKTVATSNFVNAIATGLKRKIFETNVGFKYFRPYLKPGTKTPVVCAFEESDGFSIGYANILEKDAFGALMLAIEIIRTTGLDLVEYLKNLKKNFGTFEANKSAVDVNSALTKEVKDKIINKISETFKIGSTIKFDKNLIKRIKNKLPDDGIKIEFDDGSNLLIRQSGTEPIIKVYAESPVSKDDSKIINDYGASLVKKFFDK